MTTGTRCCPPVTAPNGCRGYQTLRPVTAREDRTAASNYLGSAQALQQEIGRIWLDHARRPRYGDRASERASDLVRWAARRHRAPSLSQDDATTAAGAQTPRRKPIVRARYRRRRLRGPPRTTSVGRSTLAPLSSAACFVTAHPAITEALELEQKKKIRIDVQLRSVALELIPRLSLRAREKNPTKPEYDQMGRMAGSIKQYTSSTHWS